MGAHQVSEPCRFTLTSATNFDVVWQCAQEVRVLEKHVIPSRVFPSGVTWFGSGRGLVLGGVVTCKATQRVSSGTHRSKRSLCCVSRTTVWERGHIHGKADVVKAGRRFWLAVEEKASGVRELHKLFGDEEAAREDM